MSEVRAAARRSHLAPEARGGDLEEPPRARGQGRQPGGATRGVVAAQHRRAWRSYPTLKVRRGGCEEIPLIQGKEQWLCFAGAIVKRYSTSKVREPK